jgi:uncharacterized membrane protein YeaQ/YmgE (transglycosylase-associated protein family)
MSYLLIVVLSALVGFIGGQFIKGSEHGSAIDAVAGAVGGCVLVALSRAMGPVSTAGYMVSIMVSIVGAFAALYGTRMFLKSREVAVKPVRRR